MLVFSKRNPSEFERAARLLLHISQALKLSFIHPRHWMRCSTTPLRRGKRTAFDWTAVSEANCEVILASRRRLIKGETFYTGEMLSRALGRNLNKAGYIVMG